VRRETNAKRPLLPLLAITNAIIFLACAIWFHESPPWAFFFLFAAAIGLWVTEAVPELAVALAMLAGWILLGIAPLGKALAGFGSPQWIFAIAILAIAAAISHSGLLFRLGLFMARRMPRGLIPQSLILLVTGVVLTPLLPSSTARAALTMPLAVSVVDAARYEDRGPAAALLGQAAWLGANPLLFMFLNGSTSSLLAWGLLPEETRARIGWLQWFFAAAPLGLLVGVGTLAATYFLLRPGASPELSRRRLGLQLAILGPPSRREKALLAILAATVIGWGVAPLVGVDTSAVALVSAVAAVITARLDRKAIGELDWPFLMSLGVMLAFSDITIMLGIDKVAAAKVGAIASELAVRGPIAVAVIAVLNLVLRFVLPPNQAILILSVALLPLAPSLGLDPWVIVMTLLATAQTWFFPTQNFAYMVADAAGEGRLFSQVQSRRICFAYVLVTIAALLICLPAWQMFLAP
jgi:di/tricarboxylate transporter